MPLRRYAAFVGDLVLELIPFGMQIINVGALRDMHAHLDVIMVACCVIALVYSVKPYFFLEAWRCVRVCKLSLYCSQPDQGRLPFRLGDCEVRIPVTEIPKNLTWFEQD